MNSNKLAYVVTIMCCLKKIVEILDDYYPMHVMEDSYTGNPYKALVSCLLSLRTRDEITFPIAEKLFQIADTPYKMINLSHEELCLIIKSINYYKTKAENILNISRTQELCAAMCSM